MNESTSSSSDANVLGQKACFVIHYFWPFLLMSEIQFETNIFLFRSGCVPGQGKVESFYFDTKSVQIIIN